MYIVIIDFTLSAPTNKANALSSTLFLIVLDASYYRLSKHVTNPSRVRKTYERMSCCRHDVSRFLSTMLQPIRFYIHSAGLTPGSIKFIVNFIFVPKLHDNERQAVNLACTDICN